MSTGKSSRRVPRLLIGRRLRALRRRAEVGVEEAAAAVRVPQATVWRMERGDARCRFRPGDVKALGRMYGAGDAATNVLVEAAEAAREVPWFAAYRRVMPDGLETYLELESCASRISCYAPGRVPELLRTADYARAVSGSVAGLGDDEVGLRVELCIGRQEVLSRQANGFVFVVGEAALRRPVWGGALMARQLRRLVSVGKRPNVSVRVLPADADVRGECGVDGFEVFEFDEWPAMGALETTVFVEGDWRYLEDDARVGRIRRELDELEARALGEDESRGVIERIAARLEGRYPSGS